MGKLAAFIPEHIGNTIIEHHCTQWDVSRGNAFGQGHDVGLDAEIFRPEPLAGTTESADYFVGN